MDSGLNNCLWPLYRYRSMTINLIKLRGRSLQIDNRHPFASFAFQLNSTRDRPCQELPAMASMLFYFRRSELVVKCTYRQYLILQTEM